MKKSIKMAGICVAGVLAGCTQAGNTQPQTTGEAYTAASTEQKEERTFIEKLLPPSYVIGVEPDNAPYYYINEQGQADGLYVELMDRLSEAGDFGYELVELMPEQAEVTLISETGEKESEIDGYLGDYIVDFTEMEELEASDPLFESKLAVIVPKKSDIDEGKDLERACVDYAVGDGSGALADYLAETYHGDSVGFATDNMKEVARDVKKGYAAAFVWDLPSYEVRKDSLKSFKKGFVSKKFKNQHGIITARESKLQRDIVIGVEALGGDASIKQIVDKYLAQYK